ncbi:pyridoxal phosphate-dependent transferase [Halteromyces radiatus]|uniref:pyridoxal phosphate-dependent transferase n=1 Tax=Halteromyces radiatus TaxID=101107 RepID=UPI00221FA445|nr:pyridoxal phosphate-dependent transferase [Halteromyces radiatus]KAI8096584.1 pyridoxal phosphate-dependent transferase [Halteromyces radiatus]
MINFMKGQPSSDLLPTELFAKATSLALADPNAKTDMLQYGNELGTSAFRENLASFLSKEYALPVDPRHLCPTAGASHGLEHALSLLTRPNSTTKYCYFQEPTYFLAFDVFRDVGFQLDQFVGIPDKNNNEGLDLDYFEETLAKHFPIPPPPPFTAPIEEMTTTEEWIYDAVLYCVPTHANPTGSILPMNQRQRLVKLARKYNVLVICDDVYDILTYSDQQQSDDDKNNKNNDVVIIPPPKRVVAYDLELDSAHPVIISNGSFSKLLAPGARIGWLECHESLVQRLGAW